MAILVVVLGGACAFLGIAWISEMSLRRLHERHAKRLTKDVFDGLAREKRLIEDMGRMNDGFREELRKLNILRVEGPVARKDWGSN
jgi:hypothetical protein